MERLIDDQPYHRLIALPNPAHPLLYQIRAVNQPVGEKDEHIHQQLVW
jgi:hypothetical protein